MRTVPTRGGLLTVLVLVAVSAMSASAQTRNGSARPAGSARLRTFLGKANPPVAGGERLPKTTLATTASLVGSVRETNGGGFFATQRDSTAAQPMAAVGDTLYAYRGTGRPMLPLVVTERVRYSVNESEAMCGGGIEFPGWAYALTGVPVKRSPSDDDVTFDVFPWSFPTAPLRQATPAERSRLNAVVKPIVATATSRAIANYGKLPEYGSAQGIRANIAGPAGLGAFGDAERAPVYRLRGPGGAMLLFTSFDLGDDLSDHGGSTTVSIVTSANGAVIARSASYHRVIAIADVDRDGVDDIITSDGAVHWDGKRWHFPSPAPGSMC